MLSGVDIPEGKAGELGVGGARFDEFTGKVAAKWFGDLGIAMVVLRVRFVVSSDGGGGRFCNDIGD